MSRPILVATDGTSESLGALHLARRLEEVEGARVHVLSVIEPVPVFDTGFMVALPETELHEARSKSASDEVRGQIAHVTGSPHSWPLTVEAGLAAPTIVRRAGDLGAGLILLGVGKHRAMDRLFGGETALHVARLAHIPVLAVPPDQTKLPRTSVVGVDFSSFSMKAALTAVTVMRKPAHLHLVHVISGLEFLPTVPAEWRHEYEGDLSERLEEVRSQLSPSPDCQVELHVLAGDPGSELLRYARECTAELLAAGSHGHSFIGRVLMGSVSTKLIRGAECAVLIEPPPEPSEELQDRPASATGSVEAPASELWIAELKEFTERNAGRRTDLEIDDPEMGAQHSGTNFPLRGVDYDKRRDRVDIMLGDLGTVNGHLTHSIPSPRAIEVVKGVEDRDEALRIELDSGQVILRIVRELEDR